MRILWHSLLFLVLCLGTASAYDTIRVEATLVDSTRTITGVTKVAFHFDSPVEDLRFRLYSNLLCDSADGGLVVDSLFAGGRDLTDRMEVDKTDLYVPLPDGVELSGRTEVTVYFTAVVPEMVERFAYFDNQFCLETWFPMPAPLVDGRWERIRYVETAEPVADFYDFEVRFTYPDSLQLIAPGLVATDTTESGLTGMITLQQAHECALLVGSDYRLDSTMAGNTAIKIYYREEGEPFVDTTRQLTIETLRFMSDSVFAYPYDELVVVMGGMIGAGLEMPRMIWVPERPQIKLTIHEVIHQWFYGMINSSQAEHPWMDESLTEFFTVKLMTKFRSQAEADFSIMGITVSQMAATRFSSRRCMGRIPIDRSSEEYRSRDYYPVVYSGGALVIKTLVGLMGGEREGEFWREYARQFSFERPLPDDFFRVADQYLAGVGVSAADIVRVNGVLDFAIEEISSRRAKLPADSLDSTGVAEDTFTSEVTYSVRDPLGAPVTIRLEFDDGTVKDTTLVPVSGIHVLNLESGPSRVVGAVIDPENIYALDMNLLNNSLTPGTTGVGLRIFSGLTFLIELFEGVLWGW